MTGDPPFGGAVLIADTSARARAGDPLVRAEWGAAARAGQIATCVIVTLELVYAARTAAEIAAVEADEAALRNVPVTTSTQRAAVGALRALAEHGAGYHRVKIADTLIAAAAQEAGVGPPARRVRLTPHQTSRRSPGSISRTSRFRPSDTGRAESTRTAPRPARPATVPLPGRGRR